MSKTLNKTPGASGLVGTFRERLYQARRNKGWSQSDLARAVWGTTEDSRGYTVARNRDRVSAYERGRAEPERDNLEAMAGALGLAPGELAPDLVFGRAEKDGDVSGVHMTLLDGNPNTVRVQVDVVTDMEAAGRIVSLVAQSMPAT